ncbi:MAG: hypothetical protein ACPF9D_11465, partial [Owenweeksia sp.]
PGSKAVFVPDPHSYYDMKLCPLAARISQYAGPSHNLSLNEVIAQVIDNKGGLGEISMAGSVSWSKLDTLHARTKNIYKSVEPDP